MNSAAVSTRAPRLKRTVTGWIRGWNRLGTQTAFYAKTLGSSWDAIVNYKAETLRVIAQMSLGVGALAIIGGTLVIVTFLTLTTGTIVGIQGFRSLSDIGVEALVGFTSAYINTRIATPLIAAVGLAATIGAGATAQLGAMRISEEIDALEVMGIRTVAYLASTRVVAGVFVVIPLYFVGSLAANVATRATVTAGYGQSSGVFDHYFNTFLRPLDLVWSLLQVIAMGLVVMVVHTYYGFTASGGPAGVGEAVGRAVRTSLIAAVFVTLAMALAVYGQTGEFNLAG